MNCQKYITKLKLGIYLIQFNNKFHYICMSKKPSADQSQNQPNNQEEQNQDGKQDKPYYNYGNEQIDEQKNKNKNQLFDPHQKPAQVDNQDPEIQVPEKDLVIRQRQPPNDFQDKGSPRKIRVLNDHVLLFLSILEQNQEPQKQKNQNENKNTNYGKQLIPQIQQQQQEQNCQQKCNKLKNDPVPLTCALVHCPQICLDLRLKSQRSLIKLNSKTSIPALISLQASGGGRTCIDLICVLDVSSSMRGEKMNLLKDTMNYLVKSLKPQDRLSIVVFNNFAIKLCGLKSVSDQNMELFNNIISNLNAQGGTNINEGLQMALKTLRERQAPNKATSIFLLSDGQDSHCLSSFKSSLQKPQNKNLPVYSVQCFGFGNDHNEDLMTGLCQLKDGAFYYIKQLATLDQAFCNALGGLISIVINEILVRVTEVGRGIVNKISISKVWGRGWTQIEKPKNKVSMTDWPEKREEMSKREIKVMQMSSGTSKDFVLELDVPSIAGTVGDIDREHKILSVEYKAKDINGRSMFGTGSLTLTLLNQNQTIPQSTESIDVIQHYLRVRTAQLIEDCSQLADNGQFEQAQKKALQMLQMLKNNKKARKQKLSRIITDLQKILGKLNKNSWKKDGRKQCKTVSYQHTTQTSYLYANSATVQMVSSRRQYKTNTL